MFFGVNLSAQETDDGCYTLSPMEKLGFRILKEFDLEGIGLFYPMMNKQQVIEKFG